MVNPQQAQLKKERGHRKVRTGIVMSDKMDKTVVVRIERTKMHRKYKKYIRVWKNIKVHDEENTCKKGDVVQLTETRPLSKDKRWRVTSVLRRAN
jgi:small subunit ribosomal protein S17